MSSKRSMSSPRDSQQEPGNTKKKKKKKEKSNAKLIREADWVRDANIRLEREGYDTSTGLRKGVTQEEFDKANEDFRKKKSETKSETACSEVECQPVTID